MKLLQRGKKRDKETGKTNKGEEYSPRKIYHGGGKNYNHIGHQELVKQNKTKKPLMRQSQRKK